MALNRSEAAKLAWQKHRHTYEESNRKKRRTNEEKAALIKCAACGCPLTIGKKKYCTRKCAWSVNVPKLNGYRAPRPRINCAWCKKLFIKRRSDCCSQTCFFSNYSDTCTQEWLRGERDGGLNGAVYSFVRRWLISKTGEACSKCGWCERNETTGNIPINVDHIDGDSDNNRPENLRLLCPNCHSLTSTYGALNKGRGRKNRYPKST